MFSLKPGQRKPPSGLLRNQLTWKILGSLRMWRRISSQWAKYSPMSYPQKGSMAMGSRRT
jgi:hypothetical protein